jgi:polygalacturonase
MNNFDISSFGGVGDGVFDNSGAFKSALQAVKNSGGGTLNVGKGHWRTGPIELFSNTTFVLDEGAVVSFIPEPERYTPVWTRWEGVECYGMHPCVFATGQENITITGKGTLDGGGEGWWEIANEKKKRPQKTPETPIEFEFARLNPGYEKQPGGGGGRACQFLRPPLLQLFNCKNIQLKDFTLKNSPFWTLHPVFCTNLIISGVFVTNPHDAPNTDGIDIDSCENVLIENCIVSVGDDGIALKSGSGEDGIKAAKPTRRVTVRGCTVGDGHGGIVIGSETAAGIFDVLAENCIFKGTDRGIRIKTRRGRGGKIENLEFKNLIMENNLCPLAINMFYRCGASMEDGFFTQEILPVNDATPSIKNIRISDIRATGCRASAAFMAGLPETPIENVHIQRCEFSTDENSGISTNESDMFLGLSEVKEKSIRLINVKNPVFEDVKVHGPTEPFIYR